MSLFNNKAYECTIFRIVWSVNYYNYKIKNRNYCYDLSHKFAITFNPNYEE